jgi:hypothetical protein
MWYTAIDRACESTTTTCWTPVGNIEETTSSRSPPPAEFPFGAPEVWVHTLAQNRFAEALKMHGNCLVGCTCGFDFPATVFLLTGRL